MSDPPPVKKVSKKQQKAKNAPPPPPKKAEDDPDLQINRDPFDEEAAKAYDKLEDDKIARRDKYVKRPIRFKTAVRVITVIGFIWEVFMMASQLCQVFMVTYIACYSYFDGEYRMWTDILDWIYLFDVLLRLIVEHYRHHRKSSLLIFPVRYFRHLAIADILSLIPLETIYVLWAEPDLTSLTTLRYLELWRFNRVFRVFRGRHLFYELSQELSWDERRVFLLRFLYDYAVYLHCIACLMYILCEQTFADWALCRAQEQVDDWKFQGCWLSRRTFKPHFTLIPNPFEVYLLSLEFVAAMLTTVGYGDMVPQTTREQFLSVLIMIFGGIVINGDLTSNLTSFQLEHDEARFDLFFRVGGILEFLEDQESHPLYVISIKHYYYAMWNFREGVFDVNLTKLPATMQEDIYFDICKEMMYKAIMFRGVGDVFFRAMARCINTCLFTPGTIILKPGIHPDAIYYLLHGEVRVRSRFKEEHIAAILRPGSIFGEYGLILGFPSMVQVETHTICQVLKLHRDDLLVLFEKFPQVQEIVRTRINIRGANISVHNNVMGSGAVTWTQQLDNEELLDHTSYAVIRSARFPNFLVNTDVLDDTKDTFICEVRSKNRSLEKNHVLAYNDTVIPTIFTYDDFPIKCWNVFVVIYCMVYCLVAPYCFAFDTPSHIRSDDNFVCQSLIYAFPLFVLMNFADMMMEILLAAPVSGFYHKFFNGLQLKYTSLQFWLDVLAFLPMDPFVSSQIPFFLRTVCKFPKIFRYLSYLDNVYPLNLPLVRLSKSVLLLAYGMHIIACILFYVACPSGYDSDNDTCGKYTWMDSYLLDMKTPEDAGKYLRMQFPYMVSLHFAAATLTSIGEGDFSPRRPIEYLLCIFFMLTGTLITGYCTAALTSGLSCGVRPKLAFNQRLLTMRQFMEHHGLSEQLQRRVAEHYTLQHQLAKGVALPPGKSNLLYDAPDYVADDALYLEVEVFLEGIPIFTKAEPKLLARIGRKLRRYMIPPHIVFLNQGEVRRQMYVIVKGSVAMLGPDMIVPVAIYESTAHFGIKDMLYGVPAEYAVRTLSYCLLFILDYSDFIEVCEPEKELMTMLEEIKHQFHIPDHEVPVRIQKYGSDEDHKAKRVSWVPPPEKIEGIEGDYEDFEATFNGLRFSRIFRCFLMRTTIHPAGRFATVWTCIMSIASVASVMNLFIELLMGFRHPAFRAFQIFTDAFHWTDIFMKMHWAYYAPNNILVSHPVKTAIKFMWDGTFVYDLVMVAPYELIIVFAGGTDFWGYGEAAMWYTKLRWTRFLHLYKFPDILRISRNVFENRLAVLFTLYLTTTFVITTLLSTVAAYLSCPIFPRDWDDGDEYRIPACLDHTWATVPERILLFAFSTRWLTGIYYVIQIMLTVGFGDLVTLTEAELIYLVFLGVFGFLIIQATIADITAAQVDSDEIRAAFSERKKCVLQFLKLEGVPQKMVQNVRFHLIHTWKKSKGLQPRSLFGDLHPVLEADLFRELAAEQLKSVFIFEKFSDTVIGALCQFIRKEYYRRGQRLSRAGNLEFEMFIIASGKIFMTDKRNHWCCTLRKKDFFGEISMLFGSPRRYSAYAATAVEVFVLGADELASVLDRYPQVRDELIGVLGDVTTERFEKKVRKAKLKDITKFEERGARITQEIQDFQKLNEIILTFDYDDDSSLPFWRRWFKRSYSWFIGWGLEDQNLPWLYFSQERGKPTRFYPHPNSKLLIWIWLLTLLVQFVSPHIAIFEVFFIRDEVDGEVVTDAVAEERLVASRVSMVADYLELVMLVHIILEFITPFEFEHGIYCNNLLRIAYNYLTTPSRFWIDLLSTFPYKYCITPLSLARRLSLFRFLRLIPFYRVLIDRHDDLDVSSFQYKLSLSGTTALLSAHLMACFFYWVACPLNTSATTCDADSWVVKHQEEALLNFKTEKEAYDKWNILSRWYMRSFYWVISTVTSTGLGDISPLNLPEISLTIVSILFGVFGVSIIVGNISTGLASSLKAKREFFYNTKVLVNHLKSVGLSKDGVNLMLTHYLTTWETGRGQTQHFSMSVLPLTMRCDVASAVYSPLVRSCKLFGGIDDFAFIRNVCVRLHHSQYLPGVNILNNDEPGASLYIVFKGEVAGYSMDAKGELHFLKAYGPGDAFGKVPALFADCAYNKYYRAEGFCEVVRLHQHDIRNLAFYFPSWRGFLVWVLNKRYTHMMKQGRRHIFYIPPSELKEQMILEFAEVLANVKDDVDPLAFMYGEDDDHDAPPRRTVITTEEVDDGMDGESHAASSVSSKQNIPEGQ